MTFIRARGEDQKAERVREIILATLEIYELDGYDGVTFSKISKRLSFSRINLYNYFKCKEDIFLLIMLRDIRSMVQDADQTFPAAEPDRAVFVEKCCTLLLRHQRLMTLFSVLNTIILHGASDEAHEKFRIKMNKLYLELYKIINRALPELTPVQAGRFVEYTNSFAMTMYPASIEYKLSQGISIFPTAGFGTHAFAPQLKPFLYCILQGLS